MSPNTLHRLLPSALCVLVCVCTIPTASRGQIRFQKRLLMISPNEGSAVADIDRDGTLDIVAGSTWFAGPDYVPRTLRSIEPFGNDYLKTNGDHIHDVNQDGWPDVVSGDFHNPEIYWFENPKTAGLLKGLPWNKHLLATGRGQNECYFLRDIDQDGTPELCVNSWVDEAPMVIWRFVKQDDKHVLERVEIGTQGNGHGMGFGDINGDGREDILCRTGWYEQPPEKTYSTPWTFHRDWTLASASCPSCVRDLNQDGRNDILWGMGHDYGLFWMEQTEPQEQATQWKQHVIDRSFSQAHCLHLADLDGDGKEELITGKRVRGHAGGDPGSEEPTCLYYYRWNADTNRFQRHTISENEGIGTGLQIRTADLNRDGKLDIAVSGKTGTWVLTQE